MNMKWFSIAILVMVVFAFSPAKSAQAAFSFSVGFHDELAPYGTWVNYSNYGNVWRPYGYDNFRPYVNGSWAYTSYGPTWYGNEPFAPYVYHYGYWVFSPQFGWVWIPGTDYHAGRVDWAYGGGYIGWRPSFPAGYSYSGYAPGYGYGAGNDFNLWVVIDSDRFGYNNYQPYAYRSGFVQDLWDDRVFRQRYDTFRRDDLERIVRRPIRTASVREQEVRIGDRRARLLATADEEGRIRKNVEQVRARKNNRAEATERDTVMKRKFDDIRSKSNAKDVRSSNTKDARVSKDNKGQSARKSEVRKADTNSKQKVEKSSRSASKKGFTTRDAQKKSSSKAVKSNQRKSNDKEVKSSSKFSRSSNSDRVKKASVSSRKPAKVEHVKQTARRSEVKSNVRSAKGSKSDYSRVGKSTTRKSSVSKVDRSPRKSSVSKVDRSPRKSSVSKVDRSPRKSSVSKTQRSSKRQKPTKH
jgi:hypothetical protein